MKEKSIVLPSDRQQDLLSELIMERFHKASQERSNRSFFEGKTVDDWLLESYKRFNQQMGNTHYNLTRIKISTLHAKVKDMIIHSVDAPFVLNPTPRPNLSENQKEELNKIVTRYLGDALIEAGLSIVDDDGNVFPDFESIIMPETMKVVPSVRGWIEKKIMENKASVIEATTKVAKDASGYATQVMIDQMLQGGWREAYLSALFDVFLYGTGVIRCEQRVMPTLRWVKENLKENWESRLTWRHIPIENCYPSPDSDCADKGYYFIERGAMLKRDVLSCVDLDWINKDRVMEAYQKASRNYHWLTGGDSVAWSDDDYIDVLIHEGSVQGSVILDYLNEDNHQEINPFEFYDIEAWVLAGVVIGMRILPYQTVGRSYFSAKHQDNGKGFWGIGGAMMLASLEDKINNWFEDLEKNVDLSVAPPIFYNIARFDKPEDVTLQKRAKIPFNPDYTGNNDTPFYQPHFDSKSGELTSLINWSARLSDDVSGIPSFLSGNNQLMGGEGTFRGMKMLAAASSVLIKDSFLNIDQTMIQPAMQFLWRWNMLHNPDQAIKADVNVVARGAFGLMQKEIAEAEQDETLPLLLELLQVASLDDEERKGIARYLLQKAMEKAGMPVYELLRGYRAVAETQRSMQSLQPATEMPTIGEDKNTGGLSAT